jgi:hypothetical protein
VDVVCGYWHTTFLTRSGSIYSVGSNSKAQLGKGTTSTPYTSLQKIPATNFFTAGGTAAIVAAISGGLNHNLVLATDGSVFAWGSSTNGQVGDGNPSTITSPTYRVAGSIDNTVIRSVACGSISSHAVVADTGRIYSWYVFAFL